MKILMRTNMWPENAFKPEEVMAYDRIGSNIGNMLFCKSVARWIIGAGEDVEIDPIREADMSSIKDVNQSINEKYDMLILPFANAFRKEFIPYLNDWTKLIKKLTIPCVVVGIGAQAKVGNEELGFDFDQDVKAFCDAVLEHSASIGVRGHITKKYLEKIGVPEEQVKVIGCPSMFINGTDYIPVEKKDFSQVENISLNCSKAISGLPIVCQWMKDYPKAKFIPQENWELVSLYTGYQTLKVKPEYFVTPNHPYVKEGRIHSFTDSMSWLSYLRNHVDVSGGTRIHGNIAALIAGVPSLIIACDTRVQEICEFYKIPYRKVDDVKANPSFEAWYNEADFNAMNERYGETLAIYEQFWIENKIPYVIPDKHLDFLKDEDIFEVTSLHTVTDDEKTENINRYFTHFEKRWNTKFTNRGKQIQYFRRRLVENNDIVKDVQKKYEVLEQEHKEAVKQLEEYKKVNGKIESMSVFQFIRYKMNQK